MPETKTMKTTPYYAPVAHRKGSARRRTCTYRFASESCEAFAKVASGTVAHQSQEVGFDGAEPLMVGLDCLLRYAKDYRKRFDQPVADDYVLGDHVKAALIGFRGLLNGDGAVAMVLGRSTDSKDNGACEEIFWAAMNAAGFTEADL